MAPPVAVGFLSFTEVPAGRHHAYNAWHQLDHLPSQHVLPGIVHGERWVRTPAARAAAPVLHPELAAAQYLTLYLVTEPIEETLAAFRDLAADLRAVDRFFADRRSPRFGAWRVTERAAAPRVLVDPAVVPWRPAAGIVVVVEPQAGAARPLGELTDVEGVAGAWTFERDPSLHHGSWIVADERVTIAWVDGDPIAAAAELVERRPSATHVAAHEVIRPGEWSWFEGEGDDRPAG